MSLALVVTHYPLVAHAVESLLPAAYATQRHATLQSAFDALQATTVPGALLIAGYEMVEALRAAMSTAPVPGGAKVLVLAKRSQLRDALRLVRRGVDAVVLYDSDVGQVVSAIRSLETSGSYFDPIVQLELVKNLGAKDDAPPALTSREMQVLQGVARGLSNKAIGRELQLQEGTVKTYLRRLRKRIGARDRTHAVINAVRIGLVDPHANSR